MDICSEVLKEFIENFQPTAILSDNEAQKNFGKKVFRIN